MITAQKTVFQSKNFHIDKITVSREDKQLTKDLFIRLPVVHVLPYTSDGQVYLESQYRDAFGKHVLEAVAGHIDLNEEPLAAAKRELQEETGLIGKTWKHVADWELSMNMHAPIHVFFVTDLTEGKPHLDDDEVITLIKMPLTEALAKITSGELTAASQIATLLLFDKMRQEEAL